MRDDKTRFGDKVAIITGAASGIGLATAQRLGSEGARVVIADVDEDKAQAAGEQVKAAGAPDAWASACDVSREEQVQATVQSTLERWGRLDVIVNNAGLMVFKPLQEQTEDDWLKVLHVDLLGAFFFTKHAFLTMKPGGAIVNVSSIHAEETTPLVASYAAAKAALLSLTRSASLEGKPKGIRVNAILPGAVDTPMLWENPNVKSGQETINPADVGKPEDIAATIAYLASDDAAFVQGAMVRVDGGRLGRL
jgi:NAD(P)-dependent dehydrogenase (short-subunit alcohol dehydrogenase family)